MKPTGKVYMMMTKPCATTAVQRLIADQKMSPKVYGGSPVDAADVMTGRTFREYNKHGRERLLS